MLPSTISPDEAHAALVGDGFSTTMSESDVRAALGVSSSTVRRLVRDGMLRVMRTRAANGGRLRFLRADIASLMSRMS